MVLSDFYLIHNFSMFVNVRHYDIPCDGQGYGIRGGKAGTAEFAQGLWWLKNTTAMFICPAPADFS